MPVGVGTTVGGVNHGANADFGASGDVGDIDGNVFAVGATWQEIAGFVANVFICNGAVTVVADHEFPLGITDYSGVETLSDAVAFGFNFDIEINIGSFASVEDIAWVFGDLGGVNEIIRDTRKGGFGACAGIHNGGIIVVNVGESDLCGGGLSELVEVNPG